MRNVHFRLPSPVSKKSRAKPFHRQKCKLTLIDFTLSNARRFYSSMGKPSAVKRLKSRPDETTSEVFQEQEDEKKRKYQQRVLDVEMGSFHTFSVWNQSQNGK